MDNSSNLDSIKNSIESSENFSQELQLNRGILLGRILFYDLFYGLLSYELLENRQELTINQLEIISHSPLNAQCENAANKLLELIKTRGILEAKQEHSKMFAFPFGDLKSGGKLVGLHLSHYYEGCVAGESLVKMRGFLRFCDFRRNSEIFKESEDHLGFICGVLRLLLEKDLQNFKEDSILDSIQNSAKNPQNLERKSKENAILYSENLKNPKQLAQEIFSFSKSAFLGLCDELSARSDAEFYAQIAILLREFINFESDFWSTQNSANN